ncbi:hypothetical protein HDU98_005510 [Podochytrium sp. JEL0797]|nr:hypothetical protein HDU98_005510 [Podochytrium sp. JEL0797]
MQKHVRVFDAFDLEALHGTTPTQTVVLTAPENLHGDVRDSRSASDLSHNCALLGVRRALLRTTPSLPTVSASNPSTSTPSATNTSAALWTTATTTATATAAASPAVRVVTLKHSRLRIAVIRPQPANPNPNPAPDSAESAHLSLWRAYQSIHNSPSEVTDQHLNRVSALLPESISNDSRIASRVQFYKLLLHLRDTSPQDRQIDLPTIKTHLFQLASLLAPPCTPTPHIPSLSLPDALNPILSLFLSILHYKYTGPQCRSTMLQSDPMGALMSQIEYSLREFRDGSGVIFTRREEMEVRLLRAWVLLRMGGDGETVRRNRYAAFMELNGTVS